MLRRSTAPEAVDVDPGEDAAGMRRALAAYGLEGLTRTGHHGRGGRHARRPGRRAVVTAAGAALVLGAAGAVLLWDGGATPSVSSTSLPGLEVESTAASAALLPGGSSNGSVVVTNRGGRAAQVHEVAFTAPGSEQCTASGVSLAPTLPPTPESPLTVPAGGSTTLAWTAYMDGESDDACQGATLTGDVLLDGEPAGTVTLTAGELEQPPAPTGGLTTSTRAAVHWGPAGVPDPGWVVERAAAGTADWVLACGSSAQRPVRTLSCTDTGLTRSTAYVYRVTLRTGHWQATSRPSAPVTTQDRPSA